MKISRILVGVVTAGLLAAACTKPSEEDCKQAVENMQKLLDTETLTHDITSQVRRCRSGSTKKAVACAIAAKTEDDLRHCEFMKSHAAAAPTPDPDAASGSAPGSGSGSGSN
ncbi:MAG: hypothetical protein ABI867_13350 [Kofleriaceae bacterium]